MLVLMKTLKEFTPIITDRLFSNDVSFQKTLDYRLGKEKSASLHEVFEKWEKNLSHWENLADEAARPEKLPRIQKFDRVGNRTEKIIISLETKTIRREVVEQGIFMGCSTLEKMAKIYLLGQIGESGGVTCPLACTDGTIKVISAKGSTFLKENFLPLLSSVDYPLSGAQFITEQAGGSDVGATEGRAVKTKEGYQIYAEKWYCSAYDEFFVVTARPEGAAAGTEGLALFFVPRLIDGKVNSLSIRRLKDKLGTQALPTAEVDFEGATGYLIGKEEDGFYNLMNYVINTSRIHNAANALAFLRRAFVEARNYAEQRVAFGSEIIHYPLVQEYLTHLLSLLIPRRNFYFGMLALLDQVGLVPENRDERLWLRFLINLMKYRTAVCTTEGIKEAVMVFGANGIINDFSILPRLVRDGLILETWEGTHNTLGLQILRDAARFDFLERFVGEVQKILAAWPTTVFPENRKLYDTFFKEGLSVITPDHLSNPTWGTTHARRIVDWAGELLEIGSLVQEGIKTNQQNLLLLATYRVHLICGGLLHNFNNPLLNSPSGALLSLIREE